MSIGLDIGTKTIKVVELESRGDTYLLKASGVIGYKGQDIEKLVEERDIAAVADIILKLFKAANVSGRDVMLSLPESQVFTRTVKLPVLTDQEVSAAIKWEAEQYIPIPVKDAIVQHQILARSEAGAEPGVLVLLVAAPRVLVEKYTNLVQLARLKLVAVETELMSMVRCLAPDKQTSLLIDFGARSADVAIAKNGLLVFSRSIPTAGEALTRALTQKLEVTPAEAEEYKRVYGLTASQLEGKIRVSIEPIVRGIVDEVKKAIHFYQTEEKGDAPTTAIIAGGVSGMPELISYMTNQLAIEVLIANPFAKVQVSTDVWSRLAPYAPLYSIAVGLAMR
ncbi:type IV pilus assembly protein PilM [Candidatus Woesebacteria bacterium]|nr:type IV pilus assembly protein PilM [Candidatus Woesebacteria bacterium]